MSKILLTCGVGLLITVGGFWHHQVNQNYLSTIHVMNQGLGTCFGRINQSFTAMMIKDVRSPYLDKGFSQLTNACLEELKTIFKPLENKILKASEVLNKLNSESIWFHEKLGKIHSPMLLGQGLDTSLSPIKERYASIEELKVSLADELDNGRHRLQQIQFSDEVIMGTGILLFVLGLGLISVQEVRTLRKRSEAEKMAVGLVKNNQAYVGAMVDTLITKALIDQGLVVTAQIFKDYHESILEGMTTKQILDAEIDEPVTQTTAIKEEPKTSLVDMTSVLKNIHQGFEASEIVDTDLKIGPEECGQILSAAIQKLSERRIDENKIEMSSELAGDRCLVNFFLASSAFNSEELESKDNLEKTSDPYLLILFEMTKGLDISWNFENTIDKKTDQLGMSMNFNFPREAKVKNLISVVKGKKRDIVRSMVN